MRRQRNIAITQKKVKRYFRQIKYTNQGHLLSKVTPDINLRDEPVVWFDIPVVQNTFVDNFK